MRNRSYVWVKCFKPVRTVWVCDRQLPLAGAKTRRHAGYAICVGQGAACYVVSRMQQKRRMYFRA